jgi:hypothetical protein
MCETVLVRNKKLFTFQLPGFGMELNPNFILNADLSSRETTLHHPSLFLNALAYAHFFNS